MKKLICILVIFLFVSMPGHTQQTEIARSGDAFVGFDKAKSTWTLGTKQLTQVLEISNGSYSLKQFKNNLTGTDYVDSAISDEFRFVLNDQLFTIATLQRMFTK